MRKIIYIHSIITAPIIGSSICGIIKTWIVETKFLWFPLMWKIHQSKDKKSSFYWMQNDDDDENKITEDDFFLQVRKEREYAEYWLNTYRNGKNMKKTYKFNTTNPIQLAHYAFGLFFYDNQLCFKADKGEPYICSTGDILLKDMPKSVRDGLIVLPIEF